MTDQHHILVQIDAILDTFLACVEKANPEWKTLLLSNKKYFKRITNNLTYQFPSIDNKKIKEIWKNRDKEILQMSRSNILLYRFYMNRGKHYLANDDEPGYTEVSVTLNIYPYDLTVEEIQVFRELLAGYFYTTRVNIISRPVNKMLPSWIKLNYQQVILYDMNEWMGYHVEKIKDHPIEKVIFTFPLILLDEITPMGKNAKEIVMEVKQSFLGVLQADVVPLEDFSIFIPDNESK